MLKTARNNLLNEKKVNMERRKYLAWFYKAIDLRELVQMLTKYSYRACKKK